MGQSYELQCTRYRLRICFTWLNTSFYCPVHIRNKICRCIKKADFYEFILNSVPISISTTWFAFLLNFVNDLCLVKCSNERLILQQNTKYLVNKTPVTSNSVQKSYHADVKFLESQSTQGKSQREYNIQRYV